MLVGHFLMMGVALLGTSRLDFLAHHDIDPQVFLNVERQLKQPGIVNEELHVPPVLLRTPTEAHVFCLTMPRTLPFSQFLQVLRRNEIRLLSLSRTRLNFEPPL